MITQAAIDGCDRQTGQKDGVFDPAFCRFDPATLLCPGADAAACLTAPQVAALRAIYAGPFDPRTGARIFASGSPSSKAGWMGYIDGPEPARIDVWRYGCWAPRPGAGRTSTSIATGSTPTAWSAR